MKKYIEYEESRIKQLKDENKVVRKKMRKIEINFENLVDIAIV